MQLETKNQRFLHLASSLSNKYYINGGQRMLPAGYQYYLITLIYEVFGKINRHFPSFCIQKDTNWNINNSDKKNTA
jgi:hypothetical protein